MNKKKIALVGAVVAVAGIGYLLWTRRRTIAPMVAPVGIDPSMRDYNPEAMWNPTKVYSWGGMASTGI